MKRKEMKSKSIDSSEGQLLEQLQEHFRLRMQKATGQLSQTHLLKQVRRNIARIKTLQTQVLKETAK